MNQNESRLRTDASRTRYVALALIPLAVIVATVLGTVAATHVISQAFAEMQVSAGVTSPYVLRKEATLAPIPTPKMPGMVVPPSVHAVLSAQSSRTSEQVRVATVEPAPKRVPIGSAKLVSVPIKAKPAQLTESPYARVAAQ